MTTCRMPQTAKKPNRPITSIAMPASPNTVCMIQTTRPKPPEYGCAKECKQQKPASHSDKPRQKPKNEHGEHDAQSDFNDHCISTLFDRRTPIRLVQPMAPFLGAFVGRNVSLLPPGKLASTCH